MTTKATGVIADVADVTVLRGCACGPHRCVHCNGKLGPNRCTSLPPDLNKCPHCGYPTKSKKIQ